MRALTPPFGEYTALSAQLAGALRHTHSRLAEFAEEIAFFRGEQTETILLEREYAGVLKHENRVLRRRWWHGCVEEGIVKWLWGSFGVSVARLWRRWRHAEAGVAAVHLRYSSVLQDPGSGSYRHGLAHGRYVASQRSHGWY